jgi:hypothetical protein
MSTAEYHRERAEGLIKNAWCRVGADVDAPWLHDIQTRQLLIATAHVHALLASASVGVTEETEKGSSE